MKPKKLNFNSNTLDKELELPKVNIVKSIAKRSKIEVNIDKSGEICLKTPKAIPKNE